LKNPSEFSIALEKGATTTALVYPGAGDGSGGRAALVLAHGAGAGQRSTFMVDFAAALSDLGLDVVTFNFLYTEQRRKIPDRAPALEACYRAVIAAVRARLESARPRRRCRSPAWCCLAIHCIRPANRPNAETSICRQYRGRCCSSRAHAMRSARPTN
jgi:hypothetical protein